MPFDLTLSSIVTFAAGALGTVAVVLFTQYISNRSVGKPDLLVTSSRHPFIYPPVRENVIKAVPPNLISEVRRHVHAESMTLITLKNNGMDVAENVRIRMPSSGAMAQKDEQDWDMLQTNDKDPHIIGDIQPNETVEIVFWGGPRQEWIKNPKDRVMVFQKRGRARYKGYWWYLIKTYGEPVLFVGVPLLVGILGIVLMSK